MAWGRSMGIFVDNSASCWFLWLRSSQRVTSDANHRYVVVKRDSELDHANK